jgi:small subunit ribosomal protein S4
MWGASRDQARQLVRHGHVSVNDKRVTIPSYRVRPGDRVTLSSKAREMIVVRHNLDTIDRQTPAWLEIETGGMAVQIRSLPLREQIDTDVREQLIVELYSK